MNINVSDYSTAFIMEKSNQSQDNRQQQLQLTPPSTTPQSQIQSHQLQQPHLLFEFAPLECREELDDKTQASYNRVKQLISGKSPKECPEAYLKFIAIDPQSNTEQLTLGLLVAILSEQDVQNTNRYYRDVVTFSKDNLTLFSSQLSHIIIERFPKLRENQVKQCFWLTNQLMKAGIASAEGVCSNLCRRAAGGDTSPKNLWLIENILQLLSENRTWLINSTIFMIPTVVYTFLRLILDHMSPNLTALRQKEVDFVVALIRERFQDCMSIGRDFIRLLYQVNKIPEFEKLWHDIFNNPKSLHPNYQNPLQILSTRTPRRLHCHRVTPEMERKIHFLATSVKFGNQKRYQDWFHKQYLSTPESLSLRCDLIRFICTTIHPTNEQLWSDIMPRWAIVGWLLTTCTTNTSANHCKLALFIDWLLYDPKVETIMNIEPAILVMYYSLRSHSNVTASLLDFLCRVHTTFPPKLSDPIKSGIKKSLQQILEKRVVQSLSPLFDNPKQDPGLRTLIRDTFPEFCGQNNQITSAPVTGTNNSFNTNYSNSANPVITNTEINNSPVVPSSQPTNNTQSFNSQSNCVATPINSTELSNSNSHTGDNGISQQTNDNASVRVIYDFMIVPDLDFKEVLYSFDEPIREVLKDLSTERCTESKKSLMDRLISLILETNEQSFTQMLKYLGHCVAYLIANDFECRIFPSCSSHDNEFLEESISSPFFLLCRSAFSTSKSALTQRPMSLLTQVSKSFEATGFLILYFLRVTSIIGGPGGLGQTLATGYQDFCNQGNRKMSKCLTDDLMMAMTYDSEMFCFILPIVFGDLAALGSLQITGNVELIRLVVSAIDPIYLQELVCLCLTGNAKVINKDDVIPLIESSLNWESWEQYSLWKLIAAQSVPVENYISILPKLKPKAHPEAMSCISMNLQKVIEPTTTMIQQLLNCENKTCDLFVSSIVRYWSMKTDVKELAKVISSLFDSRPSSPQMKRKGQTKTTSKSSTALSAGSERILYLLESIRQRAPKNKLFGQAEIQDMLKQMESLCNDNQKKNFADLFAKRQRLNKKMKKTDREVT